MVVAPAIAILVSTFTVLSNGRFPQQSQSVCIRERSDSGCFSLADTLSTRETTSITTSPKGHLLASSYGQTIQLWDLSTGKSLTILRHSNWVSAITLSPDAQTIASSSLDRTIRLWSLRMGKVLHTYNAGRMTVLAFRPDGRIVAGGSKHRFWLDGQPGNSGVQFWDLKTGKQLRSLGSGQIASLAFSPNGQILATGSRCTQLWDLRTRKLLHTLNSGEATSLAFNPDGQTLITGSSKIKVWHVTTGKLLHTFNSGSSNLALSPDGQTLAVANGGMIQVWQMVTGALLGTFRVSWYSNSWVDFSLNGQLLVSGSSEGVKVWRAH